MGVQGKGRSSKCINVMMLYIEMEDGLSVNGDVATEIHQAARAFWTKLAEAGNLPMTWGPAPPEIKRDYLSKMAELFQAMPPELEGEPGCNGQLLKVRT